MKNDKSLDAVEREREREREVSFYSTGRAVNCK